MTRKIEEYYSSSDLQLLRNDLIPVLRARKSVEMELIAQQNKLKELINTNLGLIKGLLEQRFPKGCQVLYFPANEDYARFYIINKIDGISIYDDVIKVQLEVEQREAFGRSSMTWSIPLEQFMTLQIIQRDGIRDSTSVQ